LFNTQLYFNKHIVKISSQLVLIAAAKKSYKKKIPAGTEASRTAEVQCGGFFTNEAEATIQSPGHPGEYANNLRCFWTFENECATSFTITPISFDVEPQFKCHYDKLTFNIIGQEETKVFCGASGYPTFDDEYYSEYYSRLEFQATMTTTKMPITRMEE
jgi:hypothetical protein